MSNDALFHGHPFIPILYKAFIQQQQKPVRNEFFTSFENLHLELNFNISKKSPQHETATWCQPDISCGCVDLSVTRTN